MAVDRCYCHQKMFAELKTVADATGVESVSALRDHVAFGENCRLCHPYVRKMLETGQTTFQEILEAEDVGSE